MRSASGRSTAAVSSFENRSVNADSRIAPDSPVLKLQTPASGARQSNCKADEYTDRIGAEIQQLRRAVAHGALTNFYQRAESKQAKCNSPVRSRPILPGETTEPETRMWPCAPTCPDYRARTRCAPGPATTRLRASRSRQARESGVWCSLSASDARSAAAALVRRQVGGCGLGPRHRRRRVRQISNRPASIGSLTATLSRETKVVCSRLSKTTIWYRRSSANASSTLFEAAVSIDRDKFYPGYAVFGDAALVLEMIQRCVGSSEQ